MRRDESRKISKEKPMQNIETKANNILQHTLWKHVKRNRKRKKKKKREKS